MKGSYICMVHDTIMNVILALIPLVITGGFMFLTKYVKTPTELKALENLVDSAVVFAEKMGAIKQLTGSEQFQVAYNFVVNQLKALGITSADEQLIKSKIEESWAYQQDHLSKVYEAGQKQAKENSLADKEAEIEKQEADIQATKKDLEAQKEQLKSAVIDAQAALNGTSTNTLKTPTSTESDSQTDNSVAEDNGTTK